MRAYCSPQHCGTRDVHIQSIEPLGTGAIRTAVIVSAGEIDEDVDVAPRLRGIAHNSFNGGIVGDVGMYKSGATLLGGGRAGLFIDLNDEHFGAIGHQCAGYRFSKEGATTGNYCGLSRKCMCLRTHRTPSLWEQSDGR
ncbi:unannotated protein [freshwater metagenome]|uniref:Unannotated protein n=1 Tax=freshwater metagenome TaxID=449393 RepID=A0A6J6RJJ6_9ZZZZ